MKLIFFVLTVSFFVQPAQATHPLNIEFEKNGVSYSCHPQKSPNYCPSLVLDIPTNVAISLSRTDCLESLNKSQATSKDIRDCFLAEKLRNFFEDIQLYDVPSSCIKENIEGCLEYTNSCSNPPCGGLGSFLRQIDNLGLTSLFTKNDGEAACKSLVY